MAVFDTLIRNGLLVDGTGKPAIRGDLGIRGDVIVGVGDLGRANAKSTVDASGMIVAPGFVDVHAHSDYLLLADREADTKILQGITTDIGGNCGLSAGPFDGTWFVDWWIDSPRNFFTVPWDEGSKLARQHGIDLNWTRIDGFLQAIESGGISVNYASLVGHYVLRSTAYGEPDTQPTRPPTPRELDRMKAYLAEAMDHGALGFSVGFHHTDPELDVSTDELVALCEVVRERNGIFTIHLRSYADRLLSAVREALTIAERSGVRTSISHLMADGKENWGKMRPAIEMIEQARDRGGAVYFDVLLTLQARNFMSGGIQTLLPDDVARSAEGQWGDYFSDAKRVSAAADLMRRGISNRWYKERFYPPSYWPLWDEMLRVVKCEVTSEYEGMMLFDVAKQMGVDSFEAIGRLLGANNGEAYTILERSCEEDINDALRSPLSMIGSDGNPLRPLTSTRPPNPRIYGTFPRLLGYYVRDKKVLSLEQAVLKSTSLPAQFLGLTDRGELRPGMKADVVVFDRSVITDHPNLMAKPTKYTSGVKHVFVNGVAVVRDEAPTGDLPGRVVRHRDVLPKEEELV